MPCSYHDSYCTLKIIILCLLHSLTLQYIVLQRDICNRVVGNLWLSSCVWTPAPIIPNCWICWFALKGVKLESLRFSARNVNSYCTFKFWLSRGNIKLATIYAHDFSIILLRKLMKGLVSVCYFISNQHQCRSYALNNACPVLQSKCALANLHHFPLKFPSWHLLVGHPW